MIYYIVAKDLETHNEWVHSSYDDAETAGEWITKLRNLPSVNAQANQNIVYRIDTVDAETAVKDLRANDGKWLTVQAKAELKQRLNDQYGRAKMDHEEGYPDTDSMREPRHSSEFTVGELFPTRPDGFSGDYCTECGVNVKGRFQRLHVTWHNKLLP